MRCCAFCASEAKLSGEHIWDDWISDAYAAIGVTDFHFADYGPEGEELRSYDGVRINKKAKVVCEPCNNRWMSNLTGEVKTISKDMVLHGKEIRLDTAELQTLSHFAFLKAVVLDHLASDRPPFWSIDARHAFRKRREVPEGVQVWISSLFERHAEGRVWSGYAQPQNALVGFEFYTFTYAVGCLVLQLVGKRWVDSRNEILPNFRQNEYWNPVTTDIWPRSISISWPLPKVLNLPRLSTEFRDRWLSLEMLKR